MSKYVSLLCPLRDMRPCSEEKCAWWNVKHCAVLSLAMAVENNIALTVTDTEHDRTGLQDAYGTEGGD